MKERLSKKERQERILVRLHSDVTVRISALATQLGVTTETIRRDIDALTRKGLVNRTYGGATTKLLSAEPNVHQRYRTKVVERERIGHHAVSLIEPGDVLMIDSGSTTTHFAQALAGRNLDLTILTNGISVANRLGGIDGIRVILCPGDYRGTENGVYGHETVAFLDRFFANKAIIGASGITPEDITDVDLMASAVKRKMLERSKHTLVLLDHGKFNERFISRVCALQQIDHLVIDKPPPKSIAKALEDAEVRLHVAQ